VGETGGVINALFIIPKEVLDMHPLVVIEEERGPEISRRLFVRGGLFRNENARELFPAVVGCVRRGTADRSPARANIEPVLITLLQMTAIISRPVIPRTHTIM